MLIMIILASIIALLPLYFIKKYIQTNKKYNIGITIILYCILTSLYISIFRKGEMTNIYVILQILQILIVVIMGLLLFNESINIKKIIGIIFGIISIKLLI
jgi:multidrug transporter EmrE-like cation transporter